MEPDSLEETPAVELLGASLGRLGPAVPLGVPGAGCSVDPLGFGAIYLFLVWQSVLGIGGVGLARRM